MGGSAMLTRQRVSGSECVNELVVHVAVDEYDKWVDELREKMVQSQNASEPERIWLISERSNYTGIVGLVNCLRQEPGGANIRCIFTGRETPPIPKFELKNAFYKDLLEKNLVMNVFKKGSWGSYRHVRCKEDASCVETEHAYLTVLTRGDLSSLTWIDSSLKYFKPTKSEVLCHVYYASLNFKDVMMASGKLPGDAIVPAELALKDSILGLEYSGRLENGRRVMGVVSHKALATTVVVNPLFMVDVPDAWTLEEAATVPCAYLTAYYSLITRGQLRKGEKVLIHSGSGGVGQAAIAIALSMGCEVFTSVGSVEKRDFLKKRFPKLKDRNFCNSRDTSFEQHVLNATNGQGVDVALNSLADEKLFATLNCLAQHGRFLEIGKYDLTSNTALGMAVFMKNISFHGILLDSLLDASEDSLAVKLEIMESFKKGIADGTVTPLNTILFNYDEVEQAFRFMASGRHMGKIVLKMRDEERQKKVAPAPVRVTAVTRTTFDPEKSYIIVGGLGGFGLELCQWLVERGAKNVILTSRSGITNGYQKLCIQRWQEEPANIVVTKLNATKLDEAKQLLRLAAKHGPVGGIFNLALVLKDAFMENQTVQNFIDVCESKVQSTKNLDLLSRQSCPQLDWFICFSSVSCGRGNAGQSNYGYANSVMERICEDRSSAGLPGLAIQWGAIGDVGVIQDTVGSDVIIGGTVPQKIVSCLSVLDKFMHQSNPVVSSLVPYQPSESSSKRSGKQSVLPVVAKIFGIKDINSINPETSMGELGMDSLMGVELKQFLERDFDMVLSVPELRQLKVKDLKNLESQEGAAAGKTGVAEIEGPSETIFGNMNSLDSKDLVPTETIVHMNGVKTGTPVFLVHPIESSVIPLRTVAQLLPYPVYGIQCTPEAPSTSIEELAAWYWKHIKALNVPTKSIYLAGYSFGTNVAFEMAVQADADPSNYPEILSLTMLEGSPSLMTSFTRDKDSHFKEDAQVEGEYESMLSFAFMFSKSINVSKSDFQSLSDFAERTRYVSERIVEACPKFQLDDVIMASNLLYSKLTMCYRYTPKYKLKRNISLIKASEGLLIAKTSSEYYDLEKLCDGKITLYTVKGNHTTFIQGNSAKEVANHLKEIFNTQ